MKILVTSSVVGVLVIVCLLLVVAQKRRDTTTTTRERRVTPAASTTSSSSSSNTVTVKPGGNLQKVVDDAHYGDVIVLQAGAIYPGPLMLPYKEAKPGSDDYITITTSSPDGISAENVRLNPELQAAAMPKILAPNSGVAVGTAERAHHYKFVGIEFSQVPTSEYVYNMIDLGSSSYQSLSQFPHHLIFDRCYVHSTGLKKARRGFGLNSGETSILNSYIAGFAGAEDEAQGICGWNGPGPYHIINNHIEGGGQNIMFGGSDPAVQNLVPADIEIKRNFLYKPPDWAGKATVKAVIELKNAKRVLIDGNVLESAVLTGAFVITVRNQSGNAPWSTLEDVTITNNIVRHSSTGFSILGTDTIQHSQQAKHIRIANNLVVDVGPDYAAVFIAGCCGDSITIENNTVQQTGNIMTCYGQPSSNFVFRNNIVQYNSYGLYCPATTLAQGSRGNIIVDNLGSISREGYPANIPIGNFIVSSYDQIGFVDYSNGDWRISPKSKARGRGTDGKDSGVDFESLGAAVAPSDVEPPFFGKRKK